MSILYYIIWSYVLFPYQDSIIDYIFIICLSKWSFNIAIENGHRNSGFSQLENDDVP